jgi:hypothetical protein
MAAELEFRMRTLTERMLDWLRQPAVALTWQPSMAPARFPPDRFSLAVEYWKREQRGRREVR